MKFDPFEHAKTMTCSFCGSSVSYRPNAIIYGKSFGHGMAYICDNFPACDSYVGAHGANAGEMEGKPLGTLANFELRQWRKRVHTLIDPYWQNKYMKRREIYSVLAFILSQNIEDTHVGMMTIEQCQKIMNSFFDHVPPLQYIAARSNVKTD